MKTIWIFLFLLSSSQISAQAPRLVVPIGHTQIISSVAFSPDGKNVLTGSFDNSGKLWDLQGREINTFIGHTSFISSVSFSPNGKYVLTGSGDNTSKLWDLQGNEIQHFKGHSSYVSSVAFSPDGQYVLTGSGDRTAKLWDLQGNVIQSFAGHSSFVESVAFSPDGKYVLTGSDDNTAKLWDLQGRHIQSFNGHASEISSVAFSPDGKYILTGSWDRTAKLWDLQGREIQVFIGHDSNISSVAFSPDGKYILTGSWDRTAKLWDLQGREIQSFAGHVDYIRSVTFSPDGKFVLTGSRDKTTKMWDWQGRVIQSFLGHTSCVSSTTFSLDSHYILIGTWDNTAKLWDLHNRNIRSFVGHTSSINSVAFSPGGKYILTGSEDKTARLWDLHGHEIQLFAGHTSSVSSVTFSPDGKQIMTGSIDRTAKLWDLNGREVHSLTGHISPVSSVAFSSDGKYLLTGSGDKTVKLWDIQGKEIRSFNHSTFVSSVMFSPDNKYVLTGSFDKTARLWDIQGQEIQNYKGHNSFISSVAFSSNGKYILTGSWDASAKLWDTQGVEIQNFRGHTNYIWSAVFSPDDQYVLTGSWDNTAKLWDVKSGQELATLIAIDSTDWVVTTPSGLFDASPGAMKLMHYVVGLDVIDLEQLKDRYYEPGLLAKIMGFAEGGLRPVDALKNVALYPAINKAVIEGDRLRVQLEVRSGGIGKVVLLLDDNIELDANVNPEHKSEFVVDLGRLAGYFIPDSLNRLSLRAYNSEGWLKSPAYEINYIPTAALDKRQNNQNPTTPRAKADKELEQIHLYALVVGTSNFRGSQLNLKYPDKDATAFAEALRLAGAALFGKNVDVELLTTGAEPWPRKAQIDRVMKRFAAKADPNDILLVYLSGHGITYPPNSEKGQFYYLTTDIGSDKLDDPAILATSAIAQDTLQEWIKQVKARKRILILDACNSGRVVERLEPGAKALNSDQRRALERMKDRSGMFVLAGSAADKSSYEASRYGHGLLTYSLLNNMPVVAAANKHFIEVDKLFGNVREEVPRLAKGIGEVQDPELIGGESYAIGLLDENTRIDIPEEKPVFVRTVFIDSQKNKDLLHLSTAVNDYLERRASEKDPAIAYWAVDEFAGDHYYLGGQYQQDGETLGGKATLYREDKELTSFTFSGEKNALGRLVEEMVVQVFGYLNGHRD